MTTVLRSHAPLPSATPHMAPGDAQLAAAAEVVRQTYAADILGAEARAQSTAAPLPAMQSPAVTQTRAAVIQADVATTQADTTTTQAPATTTVCTDEAPTPTTPSPPTPTIRKPKGKRPARRSLICSASPMAITPPRSIRAIVQPLIVTSPHVQDSDTTSPYDDTQIPDNESVESAYFPSEPEQGMLYCVVHNVLHIGHLYAAYCTACPAAYCLAYSDAYQTAY